MNCLYNRGNVGPFDERKLRQVPWPGLGRLLASIGANRASCCRCVWPIGSGLRPKPLALLPARHNHLP